MVHLGFDGLRILYRLDQANVNAPQDYQIHFVSMYTGFVCYIEWVVVFSLDLIHWTMSRVGRIRYPGTDTGAASWTGMLDRIPKFRFWYTLLHRLLKG